MAPQKPRLSMHSYLVLFCPSLRLCRRLGLVPFGSLGCFSGILTCGLVLGIVLLGIPATEFEEV